MAVLDWPGLNGTASARGKNCKATYFHITVFSLFSVVTFKNSGCKSQSAMTSGQR